MPPLRSPALRPTVPGGSAVVLAATAASAAMIAQQVVGKASRDALFLTSFDVTALPTVMVVSALVSLAVVLWLARLITRYSPATVVPAVFALSAAALVGEWALGLHSPRAMAVAVYLHLAIFGAPMISGFWSLFNERFDPRTARRIVGNVTAGGTAGGVIGGLAAWRAAGLIPVHTMLLFLAASNLVCVWGTFALRPRDAVPRVVVLEAADVDSRRSAGPSVLAVLRGSPHLRNLSLLIVLGAVSSALLDYVFSARAAASFARGESLLRFFALFQLATSVFAFGAQALFGRWSLDRLGLAGTAALLPGAVIAGGGLALALPGLATTALLRGGEAVVRGSIFRSAYELFYTPLSPARKRATKTVIDVGCDRIGTVVGSGVILLALAAAPASATAILVCAAIACALAALALSPRFHRGYVESLAESLRTGALKLDAGAVVDATTRQTLSETTEVLDRSEILSQIEALRRVTMPAADADAAASLATVSSPRTGLSLDPVLIAAADLRSSSLERARRALAAEPFPLPLVPFAIQLLGREGAQEDAARALIRVAPRAVGQILDALLDPAGDIVIRRRIPRVLAGCPTQRAADGLVLALDDESFEVRFRAGRALMKLTEPGAAIRIARDVVLGVVEREVTRGSKVWNSEPPGPIADDDEEHAFVADRLLRDRVDRSLEHVFTVLSLCLEREPLRIAFKALHQKDVRLRGTALEYLENVLPDRIREAVFPFLGEVEPPKSIRARAEVLDELLRSSTAIDAAALRRPS